MSDSDLSPPPPENTLPSDATLEQGLRDAVARFYKATGTNELTVNNVRAATEEALDLADGFFKSDAKWKKQSSAVIKEEVEKHNALPSSQPEESKRTPAKSTKPSKPTKPARPAPSKAKKRASPDIDERSRPNKKAKKGASDSDDDLSSPPTDLSEEEKKPPTKRGRPSKEPQKPPSQQKPPQAPTAANGGPRTNSESELSPVPDEDGKSDAGVEDSESEMSDVLDEPAKPPRKPKTTDKAVKNKVQAKTAASKSRSSPDLPPEDAEIKRLQGWLVKCGIRKLWGKELKPYETPKAKTKHLRQMLEDIGMKGRYSLEKAREIKERRELAADIEAVKEGAERWGKTDDEDDDSGGGKPRRRLVRGAKNYDFLSGSDGEETD